MEVEHSVKVFTLDNTLEQNLQAMSADGWILVPGIIPVGVYHVVRIKGAQLQPPSAAAQAPVAKITIDETKVKILRNGQLIDG
jgi:hypothetical protein